MSIETKKAVLDSFRFKVENWQSELIYIFLIVYVLFTRTIFDFEAYALPVFLSLIVLYQSAALIFRIWIREVPDQWDLIYWVGGTTIFSACYVLLMYGSIALAIDIFKALNSIWQNLDPLANQAQFMLITGLTVSLAGGVLFCFRLKQRFLYGITEAGVGVLVGMHRVTIEQWSGVPTSASFYLALLTAGIYLVVRGFDNIYQSHKDKDPTLQKCFNFIRHRSFQAPKVPRRVPSLRAKQLRKVVKR